VFPFVDHYDVTTLRSQLLDGGNELATQAAREIRVHSQNDLEVVSTNYCQFVVRKNAGGCSIGCAPKTADDIQVVVRRVELACHELRGQSRDVAARSDLREEDRGLSKYSHDAYQLSGCVGSCRSPQD
jgi:hypothetical protein